MNWFRDKAGLSETAVIMCAAIGGLFLALLPVGLLVIFFLFRFEAPLPYSLGLLAGCLLSACKVILLERSLDRALDLGEEKKAANYGQLQAVARYFLTAVVLLGALLFPRIFGLFGMILGILTLQISAYIAGAVLKRRDKM